LFDDIGEEVARIAAGGRPDLAQVFEHGSLDQKVEILDHLVNAARGRKAASMGKVAAQAGRIQAKEAEDAKVSASALSSRTSVPVSSDPEEALGQAWDALDRRINDGWLTTE